jgi:phenylacetate-CoA ligase
MNLRNILTEKIALPLSDIALGKSIKKNLEFLLKSQWWSESDLKNYQNEKLKALVKHAYHNVSYYSELFRKLKLKPDDIKNTDDLKKLPILTKEDIRENFKNKKIIAQNISKKKLLLMSSSGSTGEPLQFYITKDAESFSKACAIRGWYWMEYRLGDRYIKLSQNPREGIKRIQDKVNNCYYLFSQQLTNTNFKQITESILKTKPKFIRGYPDPMLFLAKYIQENNKSLPSVVAINTTGNTLFPETRAVIEKVFHAPVFDSYSCEGGANVFECDTHNCYHSSMEYAVTELMSNTYEPEPGERGRVITTDLHNFAVPFIRYDTQDYVVKSSEHCICGKNLLVVNSIEGRDSDILITPRGKYLIVHNFTAFFEWLDSVEQFQIRQDKIDEFKIIVKVNKKYTKEEEKQILKYWKDYIDEDVNIKIHVVEDIPITQSGKRRFLIRSGSIKLP